MLLLRLLGEDKKNPLSGKEELFSGEGLGHGKAKGKGVNGFNEKRSEDKLRTILW